jgi:hypothetical protein
MVLALYDIKLETAEDENGMFEEAFGLRTTSDWDKDASMTGGFRSLPSFLRKYIGTTVFVDEVNGKPKTDMFGNLHLPVSDIGTQKQENVLTTVDFGVAYSGFLKASLSTKGLRRNSLSISLSLLKSGSNPKVLLRLCSLIISLNAPVTAGGGLN